MQRTEVCKWVLVVTLVPNPKVKPLSAGFLWLLGESAVHLVPRQTEKLLFLLSSFPSCRPSHQWQGKASSEQASSLGRGLGLVRLAQKCPGSGVGCISTWEVPRHQVSPSMLDPVGSKESMRVGMEREMVPRALQLQLPDTYMPQWGRRVAANAVSNTPLDTPELEGEGSKWVSCGKEQQRKWSRGESILTTSLLFFHFHSSPRNLNNGCILKGISRGASQKKLQDFSDNQSKETLFCQPKILLTL